MTWGRTSSSRRRTDTCGCDGPGRPAQDRPRAVELADAVGCPTSSPTRAPGSCAPQFWTSVTTAGSPSKASAIAPVIGDPGSPAQELTALGLGHRRADCTSIIWALVLDHPCTRNCPAFQRRIRRYALILPFQSQRPDAAHNRRSRVVAASRARDVCAPVVSRGVILEQAVRVETEVLGDGLGRAAPRPGGETVHWYYETPHGQGPISPPYLVHP